MTNIMLIKRWLKLFRPPLFLSGLFFIVILVFFTPIFSVNDDVNMLRMASGYYAGLPSYLLIYINPLYGFLIAKLYYLVPGIAWYGVLFLLLLFVSLCVNLKILFSLNLGRMLGGVTILFLLSSYFYATVLLQYTMVAGIVAATGFFVLGFLTKRDRRQKIYWYMFGVVLIVLGMLIRENVLYYAGTISSPFILYSFKKAKNEDNRRRLVSSLLMIFIALGFAKVVRNDVYSITNDWKEYINWSDVQAYYHEYGVAKYARNEAVYNLVGWTKNDSLMLDNWFYMDEERFSVEKLEKVINYAIRNNLSIEGVKYTFVQTMAQLGYHLLLVFTFVSFQSIVLKRILKSREAKVYWFITLLIGFGLIVYFSFLGRIIPDRVMHPLLFMILMYSVFLIDNKEPDKRLINEMMLMLFLVFQISFISYTILFISNNEVKIANYAKIMDKLPENKLIFNWDSSLPVQWVSVFDNMDRYRNKDIIGTGWPQRSPYDKALLSKYGIRDLYMDMINNKDVYLVATPEYLDYLTIYLKEHYKLGVQYEVEDDFINYELGLRYGYGARLIRVVSEDV